MAIRAIPRRLPFKAKSAGASATAVRRSYSTVETSKPLTSILIANRGEIALYGLSADQKRIMKLIRL